MTYRLLVSNAVGAAVLGVAMAGLTLSACASGDQMVRRDGGAGGDANVDASLLRDAGPSDANTDTSPDANLDRVDLCDPCIADVQCGVIARCGGLADGARACLQICDQEIPSCPRGFECVIDLAGGLMLDSPVCVPVGRTCCVDDDADGYGRGAQCLGSDCDDSQIGRHPTADELCNGSDDDCDTRVDEMPTDCGAQRCDATMASTYESSPPGTCTSGHCVDMGRTSCALYTCSEGESRGDFCATTCARSGSGVDDDTFCTPPAHCDVGGCIADVPNGAVCDEDSDCASSHCDNGFCCNDGVCCGSGPDCPGAGSVMAICEDTHTCQGTRGVVACVAFQCQAPVGTPDDSGCAATIEADTCGPYLSAYCTGASDQRISCATSCTSDSDCDADAHCDGVCIPDVIEGGVCDEASDCRSGHCTHATCCLGGDCCQVPGDCAASYSTAAVCDSAPTCQGHRDAATCLDYQCGTAVGVADDSACAPSVLASDCGLFPSRTCNGAVDQTAPVCALVCMADSDCDLNAHCDSNNCVIDVPDGAACDEHSDCIGAHCQNGFCCSSGDCCATAANCAVSSYATPSVCSSGSTCQGTRQDPVCSASFQCAIGGAVDDDSGCSGVVSNTCGLYPSISCTSAMTQPSDQMSLCPMMCATSANCDAGAFCMGGTCMPRGHTGDACSSTGQCDAGLTCTDGVCCTSACGGTCRSCAVPGSLGTCINVPSGTDPDSECAGVACTGYFAGFAGAACRRRADAPASAVSCDGGGSCQTAATVCPIQAAGTTVLTCNATCQSPTPGTCTGTTAGACTNVNPGTQSCGIGACVRSAPICSGGAPATCTPGAPTVETCNNIDDNCDGSTDNGSFSDIYEPNNSCGQIVAAGSTNTSGSVVTITPTLYGAGDADLFRIDYVESDSSCGCCDFFCLDEDYEVRVTMTVPADAGSYQLCRVTNTSTCSTANCVTVAAGSASTIIIGFDGACPGNDSGSAYVRVVGVGAPGFECTPYTLRATVNMACGY